eukprot:9442046-Heterocapsa_arctica.AAC.1
MPTHGMGIYDELVAAVILRLSAGILVQTPEAEAGQKVSMPPPPGQYSTQRMKKFELPAIQKLIDPVIEPLNAVEPTWGMDTAVLHEEVPTNRTCIFGNNFEQVDPTEFCRMKTCYTCSGIRNTELHLKEEIEAPAREIIDFGLMLRKHKDFEDFSTQEIIEKLADFMSEKPTQRKAMSKFGAVRLSRDE